jgi:hypothetical protein
MEYKRKRLNISYTELTTSSGDEDEGGTINAVNLWKEDTTNDMHIRVINKEIFIIDPFHDFMSCITDDMWNQHIDIDTLPVNGDVKTLIHEIKQVHDANSRIQESYVDTYVDSLLHILGFNFYPYSIKIQHKYEIKLNNDALKITAKPDFTVASIKSNMLVVIEDKTLRNATYSNRWKEDQVLGELFVIAHNQRIHQESNLYAVRIIGTLFTFYKATITIEYIKETLRGYPIKQHMNILRYPDPGVDVYEINALNICKSEDRKIIIEYLNMIKSEF